MNKTQFLTFLLLNFGALYVGSLLMGGSPAENSWYQELPKAPWTPPGWFFGFAWTVVMITFSLFLSAQGNFLTWKIQYKLLYFSQWILNITWNYVFFQIHAVSSALIMLLFLLLVLFLLWKKRMSNHLTWSVTPYFIWLLIAISLNGYPVFLT